MPQLEREHLFVTSKILCSGMAPRRVESAVRDSLRNLNLAYLDLFLMHWPSHGGAGHVGEDAMEPAQPPKDRERLSPRVLELWRAMEQVMDKGLVRAIGVSNFSIAQVEQLLGSGSQTIPAVNQVSRHELLSRALGFKA
jgi:diketogulonate reductase-like aldo/keto reductase